jgi:hypothetical protein
MAEVSDGGLSVVSHFQSVSELNPFDHLGQAADRLREGVGGECLSR